MKAVGKEYNDEGNLLFEGYFLNGKSSDGELKEYYENYNLKYEYEYLNAEKNGKGKEYDEEGNLKFEGEYLMEKEMEKGKNIIKMVQ